MDAGTWRDGHTAERDGLAPVYASAVLLALVVLLTLFRGMTPG